MPTINKLPKKPKVEKKKVERTDTEMRKLRQKAYQNTKWRKERDAYYAEHPLCEECLKNGVIRAASDVHHIKSPFVGGDINWNLMLNWNNLMALCRECHGNIHAAQQKNASAEEILKQLDALFDENIPDEDLE